MSRKNINITVIQKTYNNNEYNIDIKYNINILRK